MLGTGRLRVPHPVRAAKPPVRAASPPFGPRAPRSGREPPVRAASPPFGPRSPPFGPRAPRSGREPPVRAASPPFGPRAPARRGETAGPTGRDGRPDGARRPARRGDTHWHCAGAQRQCKRAPNRTPAPAAHRTPAPATHRTPHLNAPAVRCRWVRCRWVRGTAPGPLPWHDRIGPTSHTTPGEGENIIRRQGAAGPPPASFNLDPPSPPRRHAPRAHYQAERGAGG